MRNAFNQAWDYANRLEAEHDRPPFLLVCDVGRGIDIYADFTGQGRNYRPFPDPKRRHIALEDLRDPDAVDRLRAIWTKPMSLDPAEKRAKATREIAVHLAEVSRSLERAGAPPEEAASFLMRCLFAMFAEDVGLLPKDSFQGLLKRSQEKPDSFMPLASQLFEAMDEGKFAYGLEEPVRRFNGAFYKDRRAFAMSREDNRTEQHAGVLARLAMAPGPLSAAEIAAAYRGRRVVERVDGVLRSLARLGHAQPLQGGRAFRLQRTG